MINFREPGEFGDGASMIRRNRYPFVLADGLGNFLAALWDKPFATVDPNMALRFSSEHAANTLALRIGAQLKALRAF